MVMIARSGILERQDLQNSDGTSSKKSHSKKMLGKKSKYLIKIIPSLIKPNPNL